MLADLLTIAGALAAVLGVLLILGPGWALVAAGVALVLAGRKLA